VCVDVICQDKVTNIDSIRLQVYPTDHYVKHEDMNTLIGCSVTAHQ